MVDWMASSFPRLHQQLHLQQQSCRRRSDLKFFHSLHACKSIFHESRFHVASRLEPSNCARPGSEPEGGALWQLA